MSVWQKSSAPGGRDRPGLLCFCGHIFYAEEGGNHPMRLSYITRCALVSVAKRFELCYDKITVL